MKARLSPRKKNKCGRSVSNKKKNLSRESQGFSNKRPKPPLSKPMRSQPPMFTYN